MSNDTIRLDAPAAQVEVQWLKTLKVGDVRNSPLLPAIDSNLEWVCRSISKDKDKWEFDVILLGKKLFEATFGVTETDVTFELREVL